MKRHPVNGSALNEPESPFERFHQGCVLYPCNPALVLGKGLVKPLPGSGITRHIVTRVDIELHSPFSQYLGNSGDSHPYAGYKGHRGDRTNLVIMVLQPDRRILQRGSGVNHNVSYVKNGLSRGMPRFFALRGSGRAKDNYLHAPLL